MEGIRRNIVWNRDTKWKFRLRPQEVEALVITLLANNELFVVL